jgi:hypothetical protein
MTHGNNIPSILKEGLLSYNTVLTRSVSHTSIADPKIQRRRGLSFYIVDGSKRQLDIHDFVPMFIAKHTPMQYVITTSAPAKGRYAIVRNEDLIFLLIDPTKALQAPGVLIADGNAAANATRFFSTPSSLSEIDWDAIASPNEYPQCYDGEWKRCKSAEVLVPSCVPIEYFSGIAVYNELARSNLADCIFNVLGHGAESKRLVDSIVIDRSYYM